MEPGIIQKQGYSWVALPKEGILPLILLEEKSRGFFGRIASSIFGSADSGEVINSDIFDLFPKPGSGSSPEVSPVKASAFFKGHDILNSKVKLELEGLEAIKEVGDASVKAQIKKAKRRLFSFKPVNYQHVETEILLEEHLNLHKPVINAPGFLKKLKENKLFVVTEVLLTSKFTVRDATDFDISGGISASAIDGYLAKLEASASRERERENKMVYEGAKAVTFAIKASRILYDEDTDSYSLNKERLKGTRDSFELDSEDLGPVLSID